MGFQEYPKHINYLDGKFVVVNSAEEEAAVLKPTEPQAPAEPEPAETKAEE